MNTEDKQTSPDVLLSRSTFTEVVKFALITLIIVLPIRIFVAKPFIVNGTSMDPTFRNGQYLIVDQLSYRFNPPKRGDVIVFKFPYEKKKHLIKRIIALPGETIESKAGKITIYNKENPQGFEINESYVAHKTQDTFRTTLSESDYFVMGDNRPASSDSRYWGTLRDTYITGRPLVRLFPLNKINLFPGVTNN